MGLPKYKNGFNLATHYDSLHIPYSWKGSKLVFVNSMSDLFHPEIPSDFIMRVFDVMNSTPQHTYQILTKRADRLFELNSHLRWTKNIWMGVSVENSTVSTRIDLLRKSNAAVKFLSCEPLLGPLESLDLDKIDWVIVGGESGKRPRPMNEVWVWDIMQQCREAEVAFFFKQWGGKNKKKAGRLLGGSTYDEMPAPFAEVALG